MLLQRRKRRASFAVNCSNVISDTLLIKLFFFCVESKRKRSILILRGICGNNVKVLLPELTSWIFALAGDLFVHQVHAQGQVLVVRHRASLDKVVEHGLHVGHKL